MIRNIDMFFFLASSFLARSEVTDFGIAPSVRFNFVTFVLPPVLYGVALLRFFVFVFIYIILIPIYRLLFIGDRKIGRGFYN